MADGLSRAVDGELLTRIDDYIEHLFAEQDGTLLDNRARADAAGLPPINVSASEGKLLYLIARMIRAVRVLEIGTLGGYSTTWLARALPAGGLVVSLERSEAHAAVARANLQDLVSGVTIDVRVGDASETLATMATSGEEPFDLVFIDADKPSYPRYLRLALQLSRSGTVILADNVIRHGAVLDDSEADENAHAARIYNATIAEHSGLESIVLPIIRDEIDGLAISIVK